MPRFVIDGTKLKIEDIYLLASGDIKLTLSEEVREKISKNRRYLETVLEDPNQIIYGINTGFVQCQNI
jgi:histidine ammonia-lyase